MSTTPEKLVAQLADLRQTFDDLSVHYVSDINPERTGYNDHQKKRATIRRARYENAVRAQKLVEELEQVNDLLVQDSRLLR